MTKIIIVGIIMLLAVWISIWLDIRNQKTDPTPTTPSNVEEVADIAGKIVQNAKPQICYTWEQPSNQVVGIDIFVGSKPLQQWFEEDFKTLWNDFMDLREKEKENEKGK